MGNLEIAASKEPEEEQGPTFKLGEVPVHTLDEVIAEVQAVSTLIGAVGIAGNAFAHDFQTIFIEFLHWMYDTTGKHASPSDLVFQQIEMVKFAKSKGKDVKLDA